MSIVLKISAILWFISGILLLSLSFSLRGGGSMFITVKYSSLVIELIMIALSVYMFLVSRKAGVRKLYKKLERSLINMLIEKKYRIPLILFAEKNNVKINDAVKFLDMLIVHFEGRLDISHGGDINYNTDLLKTKKKLITGK
jgi:hypothetical protein